jgi:SAM-dependent methyltransferase
VDRKRLVSDGYDQVAETYLQRLGPSAAKDAWADDLAARTRPGGRILDLGCGAGVPVARRLLDAGFAVTGVDGSPRQIALARGNAPGAEFIVADMTALDFPAGHFDGIAAFFSILHVPRDEQPALLRSVARWLRPGGAFVASFGLGDEAGWVGDWLGAPMFFSGFDRATTERMVGDAGFAIERAEVLQAEDEDAAFLWLAARRLPATRLPPR